MNNNFNKISKQIFSLTKNCIPKLDENNNLYINYEFKKQNDYTIMFKIVDFNDIDICIDILLDNNTISTYNIISNKPIIISNLEFDKIKMKFNVFDYKDNIKYIKILEDINILKEDLNTISPKISNFIKNNTYKKHINIIPTYHINIACILDEFSFDCFKFEANFFNLDYKSCIDQVNSLKPDLLFIESAYNGFNNSWVNKIASLESQPDPQLIKLIDICKQNNIPTVFWNKEGSINFKYFKKVSSLFDYVFVTDESIIDEQIEISNHKNIFILPFASQPKIHNSLDKNKFKLGNIAFAGGWYSTKHLDRYNDFEVAIKPCLQFDLDIFDRNNHQKNILKDNDLYWPKCYQDNILGRLDYLNLVNVYKNYDIFLNVNSIHNSNSMTSRRIYEILSCKTNIISSFSKATNNLFKDYIYISNNQDDTIKSVKEILNKDLNSLKKAKKAQRYVLNNHTYKHRFSFILDTINYDYKKITSPKVLVICLITDCNNIEKTYKNFNNQSYSNKELKIIKSLGEIDINSEINNVLSEFDFDYICIFNENSLYLDDYISDYVNILNFDNIDVIGKSSIYSLHSHSKTLYKLNYYKSDYQDRFCSDILTSTAMLSKSYFKNIDDYNKLLTSSTIYSKDSNLFSDDIFNFLSINISFKDLNIDESYSLSSESDLFNFIKA